MKKSSPQSSGGKARAAKLSPDQRSKIASMAAKELWKDKPRSTKVTVAAKVDESTLRRALAKWGSENRSELIEKLLVDYAASSD